MLQPSSLLPRATFGSICGSDRNTWNHSHMSGQHLFQVRCSGTFHTLVPACLHSLSPQYPLPLYRTIEKLKHAKKKGSAMATRVPSCAQLRRFAATQEWCFVGCRVICSVCHGCKNPMIFFGFLVGAQCGVPEQFALILRKHRPVSVSMCIVTVVLQTTIDIRCRNAPEPEPLQFGVSALPWSFKIVRGQ